MKEKQKLTPVLGSRSGPDAAHPSLSATHLKALRRCRTLLLKDLDPLDVLDNLPADDIPFKSDLRDVVKSDPRDVIKSEPRDVILALQSREQRMGLLLDQLETSEECVFSAFKDALRERYQHVHHALEETIKALEDDSDDDDVRERTAISGDTISHVLKDSARQSHLLRRSDVSDGIDDLSDDDRYVECFYVTTRGEKTQRERWIRHFGECDVVDGLRETEMNHTRVIKIDSIFKLVDRCQIPSNTAQLLPSSFLHVYVFDKECSGDPSENDEHQLGHSLNATNGSKYFRMPKVRRNTLCGKRLVNDKSINESVPPPLPPKPRNLHAAGSFSNTAALSCTTASLPCDAMNDLTAVKEINCQTSSVQHVKVLDVERIASCKSSLPLPHKLPRSLIAARRKLELPSEPESGASKESSASSIISKELLSTTITSVLTENKHDDEEDAAALNFNVNPEERVEKMSQSNHANLTDQSQTNEMLSSKVELPDNIVNCKEDSEVQCYESTSSKPSSSHPEIALSSTDRTSNISARREGRVSPCSAAGRIAGRDSGVDSVASQGCPDSPSSDEAMDRNVFLSTSLADLATHPTSVLYDKSSEYSFYEDIEFVDGFLAMPIYLDPQNGQAASEHAVSSSGMANGSSLGFNLKAPPDKKLLSKGALMIVASKQNMQSTENRGEEMHFSSQSLSIGNEDVVLSYNKDGMAYLVPVNLLKEYGDPQSEQWFYPIDISPREASLFLAAENQNGCFIVYRPKIKIPDIVYFLSICRGDGIVVHYHIRKNVHGDVMIEGHDRSFMTICDLVEYFRKNPGRLAVRLRRCLKEARLPISPGHHYPSHLELPRSSIRLSGKIINESNFGTLWEGLYRGATVATKVLKKDSCLVEEDDFLEEALVMMNLKHDNIIHLLGVCCSLRPFYIVTEFCEKGTLKKCLEADVIQTDNIDVLFDISIQMVSAMAYLESLRYVLHRDLCANNFLFSDDALVKLSNFARARAVIDDNYTASPSDGVHVRWAAPEVLRDSCYSTKSDVWSLGVVLWELFSRGAEPYAGISEELMGTFVSEGGRLDKPPGCAHDIYTMMKSCWRSSPQERPSFAALTDKIKGKSSIYYINPKRNSSIASKPRPTNLELPKTTLSLPKVKTPTSAHSSSSSSSAVNVSVVSTPRLKHRGASLLLTDSGGVGDQRCDRGAVTRGGAPGERGHTSSSDSSSVLSAASVTVKDDLTRGERIRKSLRKLIKKRTPSGSSQNSKHT